MTAELTTNNNAEIIERVILQGDLASLSPEERIGYYRATCESLGLNPLTRPFDYINLNGKLTLYAKRDATDQLRKLYKISVSITDRQQLSDVYIVTAKAITPDNRTDESTGVVAIGSLKGNNLANALMKAETKAKRRVTLSIVGLGWLDETETETIASAEMLETKIVDNIPDPDPSQWLPDLQEFSARVVEDFATPWDEITVILKDECNFTGFKRENASEMYNCLAEYFAPDDNRPHDDERSPIDIDDV